MIYTDREYLSILALTEDRDYATYDELIRVLEERPSNAVYVERDGMLCGLITSGRVERSRDEKTRRVPFNKKFSFVHPGEYMRVRQIFRDKKTIKALPVVSEDGRLLGDYTRWDDFICADHAELLWKDPGVLQGLKENIQDVVFVKPTVHGRGACREEMFSWWRRKFESAGFHLRVIQPWEIKDHFNTAKYFLFTDEEEKIGISVLNKYLYRDKTNPNMISTTIIHHLYRKRQVDLIRLAASILKRLQAQGVYVLAFDFKENSNQFLAELKERVKRRNEEYGIHPVNQLPEVLKESFLDELYFGAYKSQNYPLPISFHMQLGVPCLSDSETELIHIQNGKRLTVNQPETYDRCVYVYGPCNVLGIYVSDQYTIPSLLQSEINQAGFSCKVINSGFVGNYHGAERLQLESLERDDIVVFDKHWIQAENFPILNLTDALEKHDAPADWFNDDIRHCNHKANQVYAHAIYEALIPVLQQPPGERIPVEQDHDYINLFYLSRYFSDFNPAEHGTIGSIVMNCNPFTFGHRFLIEEALKTVDYLIIFVVEEDESLFSFLERFTMVHRGTSDLENVMVVPSGPYILSKNTFPEYFEKIADEDLRKNTEDDITLFAERIAPRLGITYRFVGEEREDGVTNEYNEAMKRILPKYGIKLVEIPRKANNETAISASRVRQCLSENRMGELDELVPASTKRILFMETR